MYAAVLVDLQSQQIEEEHNAEDQREETCAFHDLKVRGVVRAILEDILEVDLVCCEPVYIPGHTPEVEDEQADPSKHWEDVVY